MEVLLGLIIGFFYADFAVYLWHRFMLHGWGKNRLIGYRHKQHHARAQPDKRLSPNQHTLCQKW